MRNLYCKDRSPSAKKRAAFAARVARHVLRLGALAMSLLFLGCTPADNRIEVTGAWVRAVPPVSSTTAAYLSVTNNSDVGVVMTGAQVDFASEVELHDMSMNAEGMRGMKHVASLPLAPGATVTFAPGGLHVMLFGLTDVPAEGDEVSVCLQFADAPPHCEMFPVLREAP